MRGGALPPALLCFAVGLMLAFIPRRWIAPCLVALVGAALAISLIGVPARLEDVAFAGCWISLVLTALTLHWPGGPGPRTSAILCMNAGLWAGAVVAVAGRPWDLAVATSAVLVFWPAMVLLRTPARLGVKIVASWLVAVAILAAALPLTTTPGYKPDHME